MTSVKLGEGLAFLLLVHAYRLSPRLPPHSKDQQLWIFFIIFIRPTEPPRFILDFFISICVGLG